ncbi:MAG: cation:proton antiporter [Acidobacteria bacterium]|jgi:Kef-type K+ transport system membrane component KefB|nr:cation:proton antiporter [Acidobacteriota bacterium]
MPIVLAASVENAGILLALVIMLAAAKILAEVFERLKQPAVVGEILAGVLIGPSLLNWVQPSEFINIIAEIGIIFLLFNVGLETKPQAILDVGKRAVVVAVLGVVVPFIAGYFIAVWWGGSTVEALFIGAALVATSVGITARVLGGMGLLDTLTSRIILGAAVIDDILGLLILSVVSSFSKGSVDYWRLAGTAGLAIFFTLFVAFFGAKLMTRLAPKIENLHISKPFFNAGLILCLGLSFAAIHIGVAAIIGAFLAGMMLAEATEENRKMHKLTSGVTEFLVPFFLVNIGMQLNLSIFKDISVVILAVVITIVAVLTKFIGCGLGAYGLGWKRSAQVGIGMIPRGEVGIVVAQIGLGLAAISEQFFASVLFMAIATTLIAPPFIKILFEGEKAKLEAEQAEKDIHLSDIFSRIG